ncbi:MAG: insulinase family protein [Bacteroidales bacterium]|nr:insulinase family protein [Bacteroidales bacterium]
MISTTNPIAGSLNPATINREALTPQCYSMSNGQPLYYFVDNHIDLLKIDVTFEAGTAMQPKLLVANSTLQLLTEGTMQHTANEIAHFFDFRGIIVEKQVDTVSASLSFYCLSRHLDDLLPMMVEILTHPAFHQHEFELFIAKQRQRYLTNVKKTSFVAMTNYEAHLFGPQHPIGRCAHEEDYDAITVEDVRQYYRQHYHLNQAQLLVSGNVTGDVLHRIERALAIEPAAAADLFSLPQPNPWDDRGFQHIVMPDAVQNTLRIGRILPFAWDSPDYADFMVLSTLLGGYFGSRLMSNIREDKGYTYGVNAVTRLYRGFLVFSIITDVAADKEALARQEIVKEIERLRNEPVVSEELELVRNSMLGDFIRSIDGVFERSEIFRQQTTNCITSAFTENLLAVLAPRETKNPESQKTASSSLSPVTPERLLASAQRFLNPDDLLQLSVGR